MSSEYAELSNDVNPDRFKRFVKHLGLVSGRNKQKKVLRKREDFVSTLGEFTESGDIKATPEINNDLTTLERKVGRSLELEKALEDKETALELDVKHDSEIVERLQRKINVMEKKLNDSESQREQHASKIDELSKALHKSRHASINEFQAKAHAFIEQKETEAKKSVLRKKLLKLETLHASMVKANKHDPKKLKLLDDKISKLKELLI